MKKIGLHCAHTHTHCASEFLMDHFKNQNHCNKSLIKFTSSKKIIVGSIMRCFRERDSLKTRQLRIRKSIVKKYKFGTATFTH